MPRTAPSQHTTAQRVWTGPPHIQPHPTHLDKLHTRPWVVYTRQLTSMAAIQTKCTLHTASGSSTLGNPRACCPQMPALTVLHGTKVLLYTTHKCRPRPKNPAPPSFPQLSAHAHQTLKSLSSQGARSLNKSGYVFCQRLWQTSKGSTPQHTERALCSRSSLRPRTRVNALANSCTGRLSSTEGLRSPVLLGPVTRTPATAPAQPMTQTPHKPAGKLGLQLCKTAQVGRNCSLSASSPPWCDRQAASHSLTRTEVLPTCLWRSNPTRDGHSGQPSMLYPLHALAQQVHPSTTHTALAATATSFAANCRKT